MAPNVRAVVCWLLSLGTTINTDRFLAAASRHVESTTSTKKRWILVRHGESVNNLLSQDSAFFEFLKEGGALTWQDPFLSRNGEQQCLNAGKVLYGENRNQDKYHLFRGGEGVAEGDVAEDVADNVVNYRAVYVSPMRRTLKTALLIFGRAAHSAGIPFKAMPWAHEKRGSISDIGLGSSQLRKFAKQEVVADGKMHIGDAEATEPLKTLSETLEDLPEDWSTNPSVPDAQLPYYPANPGFTTSKEPFTFLVKRMEKLQSEMLAIPEKAAILVAHSGIIRMLLGSHLLGQRPDNAAILYAELSEDGWSNVKLFGDRAHRNVQIEGLAGFRNIPVSCKTRDCNDYDEEFRTLGIIKKHKRGTCCSSSTKRLWVYDTLLPALTYFKPPKDPKLNSARATIRLQKTTSVWYTSHDQVVLTPKEFETALPSNSSTSIFWVTQQPNTRNEKQVQFQKATCDICALQFPQGGEVHPMQTLIIYTPKQGAKKYDCQSEACFLVLNAQEYTSDDTEQTAQRRLVKIAVAAACGNSEGADIDVSLAKCDE